MTITLSGCFHDKQQEQFQEQKQDQVKEQEYKTNESGMNNISEMLASGKNIKCTYRLRAEDDFEVITYVDGEKYRTESRMNNMKYSAVFDGKDMYSWMDGQENGTRMNLECMKDLDMNEIEESPQAEIEEDPVNLFTDKIDLRCEEVRNIDFSTPKGVNFADSCEMMKTQMNQLKQVQKNMPNM